MKCIKDPQKTLSVISIFLLFFLYVCPKNVFLDKHRIAFFAFKIHKGEYIFCSFTLFVPKLYFYLNLKKHCLHLKGISDPVKTLGPISNFFCCVQKLCFQTNIKSHSLHSKFVLVNIYSVHLVCVYQSCIFT